MRLLIAIFGALICLGGAVVYSTGVVVPSTEREESCPICRAVQYSGRQYGLAYSRIEESSFTRWYRCNVDPDHGLDPDHPHTWYPSRCSATVTPGVDTLDTECLDIPVIFLIRPEVEMEVLQRIPDKLMRSAFIASLNTPNRQDNVRRIRLLVQYSYVLKDREPWEAWWRRHAGDFGLTADSSFGAR